MPSRPARLHAFAVVAGIAVLAVVGVANADPPSRVARLGYMTGAVSFSPAGENDWVQATMNRPLTTGDRLWADTGARTEIQIGGAMIRMNAGTAVSILNLDDRIAQLQLTQGTLHVRVRRLDPSQSFEIDTPNLAFTLRRPGEYRIEVDPDGNATTIVVRKGQGEVYGEGAAYVIDSRQPYRFMGTGLREYEDVAAPRLDEFDRWTSDRDRSYDASGSTRYVSQDVVGYQDLDANGNWRVDPSYGNVWIPNRVEAGWAPYRDGHWAWIDPWGWTWVDDAPWGFAVSHYGRWANLQGTWGWVPGPAANRAYYAPALVAFVGGNNFQLAGNVGGVAWFPLAPREVYRPSYPVSRGYFENINRSNTVVTTTVINNYYSNTNVTNVVYANRQVAGAVVAMPTTAFVQSQPVGRAAVRVTQDNRLGGPVAFAPPAAPTLQSVRGAAAQGDKPPPRAFERTIVARTAPPAAPIGFAAQQQQLAARPGTPLDDAARRQLKPAAAVTVAAPQVTVIARPQEAAPTVRPPAAAPGAKPGDARGKPDDRRPPSTPAVASGTSAQGDAPSRAMPMAPSAPPAEQRGNPNQRAQPAPPIGAPPPQRNAEPPSAPPPAAQAPDARGKQEQRGNSEPRGQPPPPPVHRASEPTAIPVTPQVATPAPAAPAPPQRSEPPKAPAPPQFAPPAPAAQPPAQRGRPEPAPPAAMPPQPRPPVAAPPTPAMQPPAQREQPAAMPPQPRPPVAAPPSTAMQPPPAQREQPAPAAAMPPQRPPVAAPPASAAQPPAQRERPAPVAAPPAPSPPPQGAPKAEPRGGESKGKPTGSPPNDPKKASDEQKRDDEGRKPKN
jgi:hypothetical protein